MKQGLNGVEEMGGNVRQPVAQLMPFQADTVYPGWAQDNSGEQPVQARATSMRLPRCRRGGGVSNYTTTAVLLS